MNKSQQVFGYFSPRLRGAKKEFFVLILLDQKNKVIRDVTISEGSLTSTIVHPREVFSPALRESAASVIFLHNHPSGDPSPSREDQAITKRLVDVGHLLGIPVLDHVIIGSDSYFSFADAGQIDRQSAFASVSEKDY